MRSVEPTSLPLAYAAEIAFELCLLRDECVNAARVIAVQNPKDAAALEECAGLDDALATAHRALQASLRRIQLGRAQKARQA